MKLNHYGTASTTTIGLVVCASLLVVSLIFGFWAFSGRQKYKNNANQLINTAVATAKQQQQSADNKTFAVESQNPLTQYIGPQDYGTISLYYPKNWSSYVDTSSGNYPVDGYFFPGTLPSVVDNVGTAFALRLQVENESYSQVLQALQGEQESGQATVTTYSLPKMPSVVGVEVVGQLTNGVSGTLVVLPLRTEALEVWTEGSAYLSVFNNSILPNLTFSP